MLFIATQPYFTAIWWRTTDCFTVSHYVSYESNKLLEWKSVAEVQFNPDFCLIALSWSDRKNMKHTVLTQTRHNTLVSSLQFRINWVCRCWTHFCRNRKLNLLPRSYLHNKIPDLNQYNNLLLGLRPTWAHQWRFSTCCSFILEAWISHAVV